MKNIWWIWFSIKEMLVIFFKIELEIELESLECFLVVCCECFIATSLSNTVWSVCKYLISTEIRSYTLYWRTATVFCCGSSMNYFSKSGLVLNIENNTISDFFLSIQISSAACLIFFWEAYARLSIVSANLCSGHTYLDISRAQLVLTGLFYFSEVVDEAFELFAVAVVSFVDFSIYSLYLSSVFVFEALVFSTISLGTSLWVCIKEDNVKLIRRYFNASQY